MLPEFPFPGELVLVPGELVLTPGEFGLIPGELGLVPGELGLIPGELTPSVPLVLFVWLGVMLGCGLGNPGGFCGGVIGLPGAFGGKVLGRPGAFGGGLLGIPGAFGDCVPVACASSASDETIKAQIILLIVFIIAQI